MLNVEKKYVKVRSSTVLSQVELCFICPQFSVFFLLSRGICYVASAPYASSPSCSAGTFSLCLFFANFLFCSPITALYWPSC